MLIEHQLFISNCSRGSGVYMEKNKFNPLPSGHWHSRRRRQTINTVNGYQNRVVERAKATFSRERWPGVSSRQTSEERVLSCWNDRETEQMCIIIHSSQ